MTPMELLNEALAAGDALLTAAGAVKVPNTKAGAALTDAQDRLDVALKALGVREQDPSDPVIHRRVMELREGVRVG